MMIKDKSRTCRDTFALILVLLCVFFLMILFPSCTPFEREVAEEVCHEVAVAEQAIEKDLSTPKSL